MPAPLRARRCAFCGRQGNCYSFVTSVVQGLLAQLGEPNRSTEGDRVGYAHHRCLASAQRRAAALTRAARSPTPPGRP